MSEKGRVSTTSNTGDIGCPFFVAHGKKEIVCEGMIDGTKTWVQFNDAEKKSWHQATYCEGRYQSCEICCSIRHWKWTDEE